MSLDTDLLTRMVGRAERGEADARARGDSINRALERADDVGGILAADAHDFVRARDAVSVLDRDLRVRAVRTPDSDSAWLIMTELHAKWDGVDDRIAPFVTAAENAAASYSQQTAEQQPRPDSLPQFHRAVLALQDERGAALSDSERETLRTRNVDLAEHLANAAAIGKSPDAMTVADRIRGRFARNQGTTADALPGTPVPAPAPGAVRAAAVEQEAIEAYGDGLQDRIERANRASTIVDVNTLDSVNGILGELLHERADDVQLARSLAGRTLRALPAAEDSATPISQDTVDDVLALTRLAGKWQSDDVAVTHAVTSVDRALRALAPRADGFTLPTIAHVDEASYEAMDQRAWPDAAEADNVLIGLHVQEVAAAARNHDRAMEGGLDGALAAAAPSPAAELRSRFNDAAQGVTRQRGSAAASYPGSTRDALRAGLGAGGNPAARTTATIGPPANERDRRGAER